MNKENMWGDKKANIKLLDMLKATNLHVNKYSKKDSFDELEAKIELAFRTLEQISKQTKKGIH